MTTAEPSRPYRCMTCDRRFTVAGAKLPHTADPRAKRAIICTGNVVIDGAAHRDDRTVP